MAFHTLYLKNHFSSPSAWPLGELGGHATHAELPLMIDPVMPIPRYIGNFYPKCSSKIRRRALFLRFLLPGNLHQNIGSLPYSRRFLLAA